MRDSLSLSETPQNLAFYRNKMNESEHENQLRHEKSNSLKCGIAFLLFTSFVICAHSFNIIALTLLWHFTMAFLFPVGIVCALVLSIGVIVKLRRPKTASLKALFLTPCLLLALVVLVFMIGNGTMAPVIFIILFTPVLVMSGPIIACTGLVRSGVSKVCSLLLIASIPLAIAAAPIAQAIGSENKSDEISLSLQP